MFNIRFRRNKEQKGQSLVEVALFLPLVLILIAGVTEIGQMLLTSNRVQTTVRASTRFGSNGGENQGMVIVGLNAVTQTLPLSSDRWDIWVIRGLVNEQGTGIDDWEFTHAYGDGETERFASVDEQTIRADVLANLQQEGGQQNAADVQFVGTYALFDAESILGFEQFLSNVYSVQALNVMRTFPTSVATNGCTAFPIAVEEGVRSVGSEGNPFPEFSNQTFPQDGPNAPALSDFPNHRPNISLRDAQEGYVYRIFQGNGSGGFGWLKWNQYTNDSSNLLVQNLTWPGRSNDYHTVIPGGGNLPPEYPFDHQVYGFIETGDPTDTSIHIGDRVTELNGIAVGPASDVLEGHVELGRAMRFIVWADEDGGTGGGGNAEWYRIKGFVVMRLHGFNLSNNDQWILAEFIRWDDSCGQVNTFGQ